MAAQAKAAWATSVVYFDAVFRSCQQQLAAKDGTSVQLIGVDSGLFIGKKKFRALKQVLQEVRCSQLPEGGCVVELNLRGSVTACDSDAGTIRIEFPAAVELCEASWAIKQFISDAQLTVSRNGFGDGQLEASQQEAAVLKAAEVPWLANVRFSQGKQADVVYAHPEDMLEHEAMRAVELPDLGKIDLALPAKVVTQGKLSVQQLQAVCYAAKSFKHGGGYLLGDGTGCGKGRTIAALLVHASIKSFSGGPDEMRAECKRRQCQGRERRCLWVSVSRDLMKDAERDLSDIGAEEAGVKLWEGTGDATGSKFVGTGNVMFVTYATLRNVETARHIAAWLGVDGQGLIVFDEAHSAKNFVSSREGSSSAQGRMVDFLQTACPKAPVLYASATACTEVSQMAYMPRLGLWGSGKLFEDFASFQSAVEERGLDGMESVALELKARGVASCRSLSHKGTSLVVREAPLDTNRARAYDRACAFWRRLQSEAHQALAEISQDDTSEALAIHAENGEVEDDLQEWMEEVMKDTSDGTGTGPIPSNANAPFKRFWSSFWACQLRFFRQLVVSLKVPEVKKRAEAALANGGQVVITLWGTGEAQLAHAGSLADGINPSGLEAMLDQFLVRHFPCPPSGNVRTLLLPSKDLSDIVGMTVESLAACSREDLAPAVKALKETARQSWALPARAPLELLKLRRIDDGSGMWGVDFNSATMAEARRAALRTELPLLQLPMHPLDELLDVLGGPSKVAELSGRSHRVIRSGGCWVLQPRHTDQGPACALNLREQNAFQSGRRRIAIITEAASTGISLHSDRRHMGIGFRPRKRTLILAELGFSADKTMQQLGRVHRSNQLCPPSFEIVLSQVPGEARLAFTLARKLKTLGAVTRGDQHGAGAMGNQGLDQVVSNLDVSCNHAEAALLRMADEFKEISSDAGPEAEAAAAFAVLDIGVGSGRLCHDAKLQVSKVMTRFLGRSMMLPVRQQQSIFRRFHACLEDVAKLRGPQASTVSKVLRASICSEEVFALGPGLPSCRALRLEVEDRREIMLSGPILSFLKLCPELRRFWKLTRYCVNEEGSQACGVIATEGQLNEIMSAVRHLSEPAICNTVMPTAPNHVAQASSCSVGVLAAGDDRCDSERTQGIGQRSLSPNVQTSTTSTTPVACEKKRKANDSASAAAKACDSSLKRPKKTGNPCMSRTWGGGAGHRCTRPANPEPSQDGGAGGDFCSLHAREAAKNGGMPLHGRFDGPIPEDKRKAFEDYERRRAKVS